MATKATSIPGMRSFEDFDPSFKWAGDEKTENLLIKLPGFNKEHIKVGIDGYRNITISGERPLMGNKWIRFQKDFLIPENINIKEMLIKFENEALHLMMPKLMTPADPKSQAARTQEPPAPEHPPTKSKPDGAQREPAQKKRTGASPAPDSVAMKQEKGKSSDPAEARKGKEKDRPEEAADHARKKAPPKAAEEVGSGGGDAVGGGGVWLTPPNQLLVNVAVAIILLVLVALAITYEWMK